MRLLAGSAPAYYPLFLNLLEGLIRLLIFIIIFSYFRLGGGAPFQLPREHKAVACFEPSELTVENVRSLAAATRAGTSFIHCHAGEHRLFSFFGWPSRQRVVIATSAPLVAGLPMRPSGPGQHSSWSALSPLRASGCKPYHQGAAG